MLEYRGAIAFKKLDVLQAVIASAQELPQPSLALQQRLVAKVPALDLQEVECQEDRPPIMRAEQSFDPMAPATQHGGKLLFH